LRDQNFWGFIPIPVKVTLFSQTTLSAKIVMDAHSTDPPLLPGQCEARQRYDQPTLPRGPGRRHALVGGAWGERNPPSDPSGFKSIAWVAWATATLVLPVKEIPSHQRCVPARAESFVPSPGWPVAENALYP